MLLDNSATLHAYINESWPSPLSYLNKQAIDSNLFRSLPQTALSYFQFGTFECAKKLNMNAQFQCIEYNVFRMVRTCGKASAINTSCSNTLIDYLFSKALFGKQNFKSILMFSYILVRTMWKLSYGQWWLFGKTAFREPICTGNDGTEAPLLLSISTFPSSGESWVPIESWVNRLVTEKFHTQAATSGDTLTT